MHGIGIDITKIAAGVNAANAVPPSKKEPPPNPPLTCCQFAKNPHPIESLPAYT